MIREGVIRRGRTPVPTAERLWARVRKSDGCWTWLGNTNALGYGRIKISGVNTPALVHRVSWELHNGPIPQGLHCLHRCDNPPCVNPEHLFLGTDADNVRDMIAKGRDLAYAARRAKTHCKHGHEYTSENTDVRRISLRKGPSRTCRICKRRWARTTWQNARKKGGRTPAGHRDTNPRAGTQDTEPTGLRDDA